MENGTGNEREDDSTNATKETEEREDKESGGNQQDHRNDVHEISAGTM